MNELSTYESLLSRVINLSQHLWDQKVTRGDIKNWLQNFESNSNVRKCEQTHALFVLSNFLYFGNREIRALLKSAYRDKFKIPLINKIRKQNSDSKDAVLIEARFMEELNATKFLGVGNPSESGTHLLYYFRQENRLSKENFINAYEIFDINSDRVGKEKIFLRDREIKRYIFVDDFCGSGTQALQYSDSIVSEIKRISSNIEVFYIPLFSTEFALKNIRDHSKFDVVDPVFKLDGSFKVFSSDSRFFKNCPEGISREFAKEVFLKYGRTLWPGHPLGYEDGQQIIGFEHNVPDNTLPTIWFDENHAVWRPIMKRYHKIG